MASRKLIAAQNGFDYPDKPDSPDEDPSLTIAKRVGAWMHNTGRTRPWQYAHRGGGRIEVNGLTMKMSRDGTQFERVS